MKTENVICY